MSETFTREDLVTAGNRLGRSTSVKATLAILEAAARSSCTTAAMIGHAACLAGHESPMRDVLEEARRLRQPVIENGDDALTVEELTEAMKRVAGTWSSSTVERRVADIMQHIRAHRIIPEYPEGTIVTDAQGIQWKRKGEGWSRHGWSADIFPLGEPRRPLKVT